MRCASSRHRNSYCTTGLPMWRDSTIQCCGPLFKSHEIRPGRNVSTPNPVPSSWSSFPVHHLARDRINSRFFSCFSSTNTDDSAPFYVVRSSGSDRGVHDTHRHDASTHHTRPTVTIGVRAQQMLPLTMRGSACTCALRLKVFDADGAIFPQIQSKGCAGCCKT